MSRDVGSLVLAIFAILAFIIIVGMFKEDYDRGLHDMYPTPTAAERVPTPRIGKDRPRWLITL